MTPPPWETIQEGEAEGVEIRSLKGTSYLFALFPQKGRATACLLQEQLPGFILHLEFPKKMRWGDVDITYARPLRWIIALFGAEVIPFHVGPVEAGRITYGHRQLAPHIPPLEKAQDYFQSLHRHFVMADPRKREEKIQAQLDALEKQEAVKIIERERLIPEIVNLVEWPYLTFAPFASEFLRAPKEVLISEMVEHQKYFPVTDLNGSLKNLFVMTANIPATVEVCRGNQRVLSARLSDGVFLYEEDLKTRLEDFNEKLKKVTFQKDLGTVYQKVQRLLAHAEMLQKRLRISTPGKVERAALFSKADLASQMVYEFPELQGVMGAYYALAQGEEQEVAKAIEEHWRPRGEYAPLPETETGVIVSLADKFDNLLGCFSLGLKPTSSSDPYALRRQVLGIIKIVIKGKLELPLRDCLLACADSFPLSIMHTKQQTIDEIVAFITNRVKTVFQDDALHKDEIEASLAHGVSDIYDAFCRVKALHQFRKEAKAQFSSLYEVYKRAKGQLNGHEAIAVIEERLIEPAEQQLYAWLNRQEHPFQEALAKRNYHQAYALIAMIQPPLAQLFDQVKILADDPAVRENRLALLQRIFNLFGEILDFSKIQEKRYGIKH